MIFQDTHYWKNSFFN